MPASSTLLMFAASAVALVVVPGPNLIYIVSRSVDQGSRAGVASALGVETATLLHVAAAALGLSAVLASSATAFAAVKYAGVAYLLVLAVKALRARDGAPDGGPRGASALSHVYLEGVLVNLLNPKVALFFLALLPQFVEPAGAPAWQQILVLGGLLATIGLASDLVYALVAGRAAHRLRASAGLAARRYLASGVYLALAAAAMATGRRSGH